MVLRMKSKPLTPLQVQCGEPSPEQPLLAADEILVQGWPLSSSTILTRTSILARYKNPVTYLVTPVRSTGVISKYLLLVLVKPGE